MEQLWGLLGKVAVVLGIILTVLKIREHFKNSGSKLVAKVEPLKIKIPPQFFHFASGLKRKWSDLDIYCKMSRLTEAEYSEIATYLDHLYDDISHGVFSQALNYDGCWQIEIKNNSANLCKHVHLDIPYCNYATIRQQNNVHCTDINQIIKLDEIRPDETVHITAWVTMEPSFYSAKRIKLNHDSGKGIIKPIHTIDSDSPINSLSYQIKKDTPTVFIMAVIVVIVLAIFNKNPTEPLEKETAMTDTNQTVISTNATPEKSK